MRLGKISAKSASTLFLMLSFLCVLCAFQAVPAAVASHSVSGGIAKGAIAGVMAAVFGWAAQKKAQDGTHEDFDIAQAVVTALVGAAIGAYAAYKNMSIDDVENMPVMGAIVMGVETVIKVVWRNGKLSFQRALGTVKAGSGAANPTIPAPDPSTPPKA